ncbi:MAG: hypothetical protein JWR21_2723 [Herminiimonas sp.]|nr:hypothetical protein [Herminiimonas sp.]
MESVQLLTSNTWPKLAELSKSSGPVKAAIAYVTAAHIRFQEGDLLVCDASDKAIRSGMTSAAVLSKFVRDGAQVYSIPGMHVKMGTFGRYAFIGSANMSATAGTRTLEASLLTTDIQVRSSVLGNLDELLRDPTLSRVDDAFVRRIEKLPVASGSAWPERASDVISKPPPAPNAWWVSTKPLSSRAQRELIAQQAELAKIAAKVLRGSSGMSLQGLDAASIARLQSVEHIVFATSARILTHLRCGDILVVCHTGAGGRATVSAPATFLATEVRDGRAYVLYLRRPGAGTLAWSKMRARLQKIGSTITADSLRRLTKRESPILGYLNTL